MTCVGLRAAADWLAGCRHVPCRRVGAVAFACVELIGFSSGGNLDLAELAVPILVLGVVAQAVLVVEFVGDLVKRGFELSIPRTSSIRPPVASASFLSRDSPGLSLS